MSKSSLKLKYFNIFNLTNYFQSLSDDIMQEEEDIIDIVYESSKENKFIFSFLMLLSKGTLIYFEYNTTTKKVINLLTNTVLTMLIKTDITWAELSFFSPIIVVTNSNKLILIETKQRPFKLINANKEEITTIYYSSFNSKIFSIKFNCVQSNILAITKKGIKVLKIERNLIENKNEIKFVQDINLNGIDIGIDYSMILGKKLFIKMSDFSKNTIIISYITNKPTSEDQIFLGYNSEIIPENRKDLIYLNLVKITLENNIYKFTLVHCFAINKSFVKIEFSYFYEKMFILFEGGIVCCVNNSLLNSGQKEDNKNEPFNDSNSEINIFNSNCIFRYSLNSSKVKLIDIYIHPSSNFIVVRDSQNSYLFFDFTMNLYYIMYNSKITVKLNMNSFDKSEKVNFIKFKPYELNQFVTTYLFDSTFENKKEFQINNKIKSFISREIFISNSMFFYNSRVVNGIFIEISSKFNLKNTLNPIMNEFQLIKNHLRGQNFESSFKILSMLSDVEQWITSLFLITNKLCHHPENILLIKKHSLDNALKYIKDKTFNDEEKNKIVENVKNLCFTNIVIRCLSIKQYEYGFLIIESLELNHLFKMLHSHCKLTKFLGICYLACEELEKEKEDANIIKEINQIIKNTNFTLSLKNLQSVVKDIDQLINSEKTNLDYLRKSNNLEINILKYYEGLQLEMKGKLEEAKEVYQKNGFKYDYLRVKQLSQDINNIESDEPVLEFNDIKLEKNI